MEKNSTTIVSPGFNVPTGFARLKHMQISGVDGGCAAKALGYLDRWILEPYQDIVMHNLLDQNNLTSMVAMYLYCRGFCLAEKPIPSESKVAVDYFLGQARAVVKGLKSKYG